MYRLLKFKTRSNSLMALSLNSDFSLTEKSCQFCNILHSCTTVPYRYQSTVSNPNPAKTHKIRKRRSKKKNTTELLEVSKKATLERTTKVQKANVKDLEKLLYVNREADNLDRKKNPTNSFYHLGEHTYDNLSVINQSSKESNILESLTDKDWRILSMLGFSDLSNISSEADLKEKNINIPIYKEDSAEIVLNEADHHTNDTAGVLDSIDTNLEEDDIEEPIEFPAELTRVRAKKTTAKPMTNEEKEFSRKSRKEMMSKSLAAYIETCVVQKKTRRAEFAYRFCKSKCLSYMKSEIDDINVYNALLKTYSSRGFLREISDLLKIMENAKAEPNLQTYIILLQSLAEKAKKTRMHEGHIVQYIKDAQEKGFTFDRMMNEGAFLNNERESVLRGMKYLDPKYEPIYDLPLLQYNNELVNDLNNTEQLQLPLKEGETDGLFSKEDLRKKVAAQLEQEEQISITINNIEARETPSEKTLQCRNYLNKLHESWRLAARDAFERELWFLLNEKGSLNPDMYLNYIPIEDFVTIIVEEAKKLALGSETYSPTVQTLYQNLGNEVYRRYLGLRRKNTGVLDKILSIHNEYCEYYANSHKKLDVLPSQPNNLNSRQIWQWIEHQHKKEGATLHMDHKEWVVPILTQIGKILYNVIIYSLKIDVNCMKPDSTKESIFPAFYTIFRYENRKVRHEIKPIPRLVKLVKASVPETLNFPVHELPMLCPPVPWTSIRNGSYLISSSHLVRLPMYAQSQRKLLEKTPLQNMYPVLDSLNQLSAVPWKVNTKILDIITEVFNTGGSAKLDVPQPSSSLALPVPPATKDGPEVSFYKKEMMEYKKRKSEMYSLRCDCLYRLSLAHHFRDKIFWLPHNIDFRGRVYPLPPHLNHLGSDLARSILVFAEPRPLGKNGLDWLKIHLINLTGQKKRDSVSERLRYANECMDLIFDSVDNPLDGKKWWQDSDEPWQTLACCMEIADVIRSGDPENYRSSFPVHQDGSCNGLQHYAALGRDKTGGFSVNLCPADVPQDVYSAVVTLVEQKRKADAENGVEMAQLLEGHIKRKVIKQTIMTSVYGVTWFGARLQIAKQLKDIENFPQDKVFAASQYLTTNTFESLRSMFTSAKEIQDWFTECAKFIASIRKEHVEWVSPLGLPIVQPYIKYRTFTRSSFYEGYLDDRLEKPNAVKHKNAFPPNFIHSLDSSHMMLTSLNCERNGLTFVSVHDCFWTHPSTVEIMNRICRKQFVALHSQPILEELSLYFSQKYGYEDHLLKDDGSISDLVKKKMNRVLNNLPKTGDLDINEVLKSVYFFS